MKPGWLFIKAASAAQAAINDASSSGGHDAKIDQHDAGGVNAHLAGQRE